MKWLHTLDWYSIPVPDEYEYEIFNSTLDVEKSNS
nr:MAG TPA: hypothetical protein [Caudoviricetes sp.]